MIKNPGREFISSFVVVMKVASTGIKGSGNIDETDQAYYVGHCLCINFSQAHGIICTCKQ